MPKLRGWREALDDYMPAPGFARLSRVDERQLVLRSRELRRVRVALGRAGARPVGHSMPTSGIAYGDPALGRVVVVGVLLVEDVGDLGGHAEAVREAAGQ